MLSHYKKETLLTEKKKKKWRELENNCYPEWVKKMYGLDENFSHPLTFVNKTLWVTKF